MVRHFAAVLIMFGIVVGVLYGLVNTTMLSEYYVPRFMNSQVKGLEVQSFKVGRQLFRFPDTIELYDIQGRLVLTGKDYAFTAAKLTVYDLQQFFQNRQQLKILLEGFNGSGALGRVDNFKIRIFWAWEKFFVTGIDGIFHGNALSVPPYDLGEFTGRVKGNGKKVEFFELATNSYGGLAKGQLQVEFKPDWEYVLWLEYDRIQAAKVRPTGNRLFAQLDGTLQGTLRVLGNRRVIDLLAMNFTMPQGGEIQRTLLQKMIGPIDDLETKAQLETLLLSRDSFPVDSASFAIHNVPGNKVLINFDIINKAEQLRLKGSPKFPFDPSLKSIFHQPKKKSLQQQQAL